MSTRTFAVLLGGILLLGAALGFVPALLVPSADIHPLSVDTPHDQLFGLFPVNAGDNILHAVLGLWGLFWSRGARTAARYLRLMTGILILLTLLGFVPALSNLLPLYGNDIWLHALFALPTAYFGWVHRSAPDAVLSRPDGTVR
ncbi:DUF4383 domain-containing protein [Sphingosinicella sp. LHD-64]|uniref:DUF4383 domain-containing protein n=1 Tax=Sphingosinicella sp. LHD-64 TaxID=3072139 RepID=UPI00280E9113|nr:DUF4383 domain-containing protein [Sphingosinicella sp. LHD-64]MDQ8757911.1 DUF4383 domain-containing protein [Sphingosinicella sp. LHD-64]